MKKAELKKLLKPMIKECIKEVIFEEGILSNIVSEVATGLGRPTLVETKQLVQPSFEDTTDRKPSLDQRRLAVNKHKEQLLSAINTDAYGGVDIFEGTTPLSTGGSVGSAPQTQGPLSDIDPQDPGVDISSIMGLAGDRWSAHMK
tara:strand:+ start:278 stop:712 length:435 start_codon:yes stop_codon:yes gene_type:complete